MKAVWKNTTIAESDNTVPLEGNQYFPPDSVNMEYLCDGSTEYTCPWKGESKYYDVAVGGEKIENSAWAYPEPKTAAENIKGHVAFDLSKGIEIIQ